MVVVEAAASPAVVKAVVAMVVDRAAVAVRVAADHPVDSVAAEAAATADAIFSYQSEVSARPLTSFY